MRIFSILGKSNRLYFPGNFTYFRYKEHYDLYQKIFSRLGIDFKVLRFPLSSGIRAYEAGYESDARKLARKNLDIFKSEEVGKIITTNPCCYKMLLDYNELLPDWDIEVENLWKMIKERLESKPRLIKHKAFELVGYHDNCYLGRHCGIYDIPRDLLNLIGYEVKELEDSRENSLCCGSCGGLRIVNMDLADEVARERVLQFRRAGIKKVVVFSIEDYDILKRNSKNTGVEILELSEVLGSALGIRPRISEREEHLKDEEKILEAEGNRRPEQKTKGEGFYDKGGRDI